MSGPDELGETEGDENGPPRKRRALLLPAPEPGDGVPEANRFVWKGKGRAWDPAGAAGAVPPDARRDEEGKYEDENVEGASRDAQDGVGGAGAEDEAAEDGADEGTERSTEAGSEAGDEDEFAKLVSGT